MGVRLDLCLRCAEKEREPICFSCVLLSCQSELGVWFMSSIGLNTVLGKTAALVSVSVLQFKVGAAKGKWMMALSLCSVSEENTLHST